MPLKPIDNLILVYTKFQQLVVSLSIEQGILPNTSVIIDHNLSSSKSLKGLKNYIFLGENKLLKSSKILFYRLVFGFRKVNNLAIPHNDGLLANFFYQKAIKNNHDVTLYYEGVLSFYDFQRSDFLRKYSRFRELNAYLLFFKYHNFDNIYPYDQEVVKQIIVPELKHSLGAEHKKTLVKFPFLKIKPEDLQEDCGLIIGTPLYGTTEAEKKKIFNKFNINTKGLSKVVYKPHPKEDLAVARSLLREDIELFEDNNLPVENIFMKLKPKKIFSSTSSSIINIKLANEEAEVTTFWSDGLSNKNSIQIRKVFENINIQVVYE